MAAARGPPGRRGAEGRTHLGRLGVTGHGRPPAAAEGKAKGSGAPWPPHRREAEALPCEGRCKGGSAGRSERRPLRPRARRAMDRYLLLLSWGERGGEGAAAGGPGPGAGTAAGSGGAEAAPCGEPPPRGPAELARRGLSLRPLVWDLGPSRLSWTPTSLNPPRFRLRVFNDLNLQELRGFCVLLRHCYIALERS